MKSVYTQNLCSNKILHNSITFYINVINISISVREEQRSDEAAGGRFGAGMDSDRQQEEQTRHPTRSTQLGVSFY